MSIPVCITIRKHVKHLTVNQLSNQATAKQLHSSLTSFGYTCQQSLKIYKHIFNTYFNNKKQLSECVLPSCSQRCRVVSGAEAEAWAGSAGQRHPVSGSQLENAGSHCCRCRLATDSDGQWTECGPKLPEPTSDRQRIKEQQWIKSCQRSHTIIYEIHLLSSGSYPANFVTITSISTHHVHQSFAVALDDNDVLSLQFWETIFRSCKTLPHCLPCWGMKRETFSRWHNSILCIRD